MDFIQLIDIELYEKYYHNRAVSSVTYWSLIVAYSLLIVAGSIGNLLVILAVVNNKSKCSTMDIEWLFNFQVRNTKSGRSLYSKAWFYAIMVFQKNIA